MPECNRGLATFKSGDIIVSQPDNHDTVLNLADVVVGLVCGWRVYYLKKLSTSDDARIYSSEYLEEFLAFRKPLLVYRVPDGATAREIEKICADPLNKQYSSSSWCVFRSPSLDEARELTVDEISKQLGYKVKIVGKKSK